MHRLSVILVSQLSLDAIAGRFIKTLSRLRWGSVPMGYPATHLEAQGNNTL